MLKNVRPFVVETRVILTRDHSQFPWSHEWRIVKRYETRELAEAYSVRETRLDSERWASRLHEFRVRDIRESICES